MHVNTTRPANRRVKNGSPFRGKIIAGLDLSPNTLDYESKRAISLRSLPNYKNEIGNEQPGNIAKSGNFNRSYTPS
jgi:hypothetical protein